MPTTSAESSDSALHLALEHVEFDRSRDTHPTWPRDIRYADDTPACTNIEPGIHRHFDSFALAFQAQHPRDICDKL